MRGRREGVGGLKKKKAQWKAESAWGMPLVIVSKYSAEGNSDTRSLGRVAVLSIQGVDSGGQLKSMFQDRRGP